MKGRAQTKPELNDSQFFTYLANKYNIALNMVICLATTLIDRIELVHQVQGLASI